MDLIDHSIIKVALNLWGIILGIAAIGLAISNKDFVELITFLILIAIVCIAFVYSFTALMHEVVKMGIK